MITRADIIERVAEWQLTEEVVEKDYVLGWLLWGIGQDPVLGERWVFKGGTCLKKCYIETHRFSEDLDFTVLPGGPYRPEEITPHLERTLQRVRTDDLYGYYGTVADNTLHTDQRPGLPVYIPPDGTPGGTIQQLRARVRQHPYDGPSWLGLAYGEEVVGNRRAALAAAKRARAVDPTAVSPRVAVAVIGYDKADPTASFAVLGPLTAQASDPTEVLFHLGLLLYWRKQDTDAVAQWRQVVSESSGSIYGKIAAQLMRQIS